MGTASPSTPVSRPREFFDRIGFHRWRTIEDTGINLYQQCDICRKRRIAELGGGHQPVDRQWVDTGKFRQLGPPPRSGTAIQRPPARVIVVRVMPDQVGPVGTTEGGTRMSAPTIGMDNAQRLVGTWGDRTFPDSVKETIAAHFLREAVALYMAAHAEQFRDDWENGQCDLYEQIETEVEKAWKRTMAGNETGDDYLGDPQRLPTEAADCMMLLYHFAHRCGFSLSAVSAAKFAEIQQWQWGTPDAHGVIEREKDADGEA